MYFIKNLEELSTCIIAPSPSILGNVTRGDGSKITNIEKILLGVNL